MAMWDANLQGSVLTMGGYYIFIVLQSPDFDVFH